VVLDLACNSTLTVGY